jgi:hypothetical protein
VGPGSRGDTPFFTFTPDTIDQEYVVQIPTTVVEGWISGENHGVLLVGNGSDGS